MTFQDQFKAQNAPASLDRPLSQRSDIDQNGDSSRRTDSFLLYSNDEVRMRTISGGILGAPHESTSTEEIRKTRISFELHPSVFFEDFFADDFLANRVNEEAVIKNLNENPQMSALVSLLFGEEFHANIRMPRAA